MAGGAWAVTLSSSNVPQSSSLSCPPSCRVSYVDPATGECISGVAKIEDYKPKAKSNQQLEITAKVANAAIPLK